MQKMDRLRRQNFNVEDLDPELKVDDDNIMDVAYALINNIPVQPLFPDAKAHEERIKQEKELLTGTVEEGIYVCFKCKSKRVTMIAKQMRSADEAMNANFFCQDCGETRIG